MATLSILLAGVSYAAQAQTFTVLHAFTGGQDGRSPTSDAILDRAGNIYGAAGGGSGPCIYQGLTGCGIVFRLKHSGSGWVVNTLYNFLSNGDGQDPTGVNLGPDGVLYGTTPRGGLPGCNGVGCGTVFRLNQPTNVCTTINCTWTKTNIYRFTGGNDGVDPGGELAFDQAGNIYDSTLSGGGLGQGTAFELSRAGNSWAFNLL